MKHVFSCFVAIMNEIRVRGSINYKDKGGVIKNLNLEAYYLFDLVDTLYALMLATGFYDFFYLDYMLEIKLLLLYLIFLVFK